MSFFPFEKIQKSILLIRGHKMLLDSEVAKIYGVPTKRLNEQVRRNLIRFPGDFIFQLENQEVINLKSQTVISSWGGVRTPPYALTELGIAMLSTVLNSSHAIQVNIEIMRTFVSLRKFLGFHKELEGKLKQLENKYDYQFKVVFDAIREFMTPPESGHREIGIHTKK